MFVIYGDAIWFHKPPAAHWNTPVGTGWLIFGLAHAESSSGSSLISITSPGSFDSESLDDVLFFLRLLFLAGVDALLSKSESELSPGPPNEADDLFSAPPPGSLSSVGPWKTLNTCLI